MLPRAVLCHNQESLAANLGQPGGIVEPSRDRKTLLNDALLPEERALVAPAQPRLLVAIHNPVTGRLATAELAWLLRHELEPEFAVQLFETQPDGEHPEEARALIDEAVIVLASGGDGTVNRVAGNMVGREIPLAILPSGTTNIIARGLGIPTDPFAVCRLIRGESIAVAIDVAAVGDRYLLHMGGAGYDAQLMAVTSRAFKRGFGLAAYILFGARGLFDQPSVDFTILVDGRVIHERGWMALVANGGEIMVRGLHIGPNISSTDGLLDLVLFTAPRPRDAVLSFLSILTRHYRSPYLRYEHGRQIEVHADPALPVEFDGDPAGETPFIVEVLPRALTVLVPPPGSNGLLGPWLRRNWPTILPPPPVGVLPPEQ
ncbi:MAG: diacylglycerol/lipid kinase family protein [Thermomicrobiales bacterium]